MRASVGAAIGAAIGLALGGGLFARAAHQVGYGHTFACPAGWAPGTPAAVPDAETLLACEPAVREDRATMPYFGVYRVAGHAADPGTQGAAALAVARGRGVVVGALPPGAPDASSPEGGRFAVITRDVERPAAQLVTDVYFVSGGRKFGLLTIVHAPRAPFARAEKTAEWLATLRGTAPWGAPNSEPFAAECPAGFEPLEGAGGARPVVRCSYGAGSSWFTMVSLTWDEGDFGREEDRARVASALANRVASAQAQAATARVTVPPEPFTLARNVDALHARVETDQTAPVTARVSVMFVPGGVDDVLAVGVAEPDVALTASVREAFRARGLLHTLGPLDRPARAGALAAVLIVLGALAGWFATRRRNPTGDATSHG